MIETGALENPKVDEIIGIHTGNIWPGLKPGQIGWRAGPFMAATSRPIITFEGKGGHGATPHLTVDPIVMAAEAIVQLQTLVSREISPFEPAVVSIGQIEGGTANNIIPERCKLVGTIRSFNPEVHAFIKERIKGISEGVASGARGRASVEFIGDIPAVINDETCSRRMRDILTKTLGGEYVAEVALPTSGSEDYAFYLEKIPGAFFYHCGMFEPSPSGETVNYPHHHPKFDINESVFWTGAAAMAAYALHWQE
jgi:amidohydrolase